MDNRLNTPWLALRPGIGVAATVALVCGASKR